MKNHSIKEMDKISYFNISEDEILNNDRIKVYLVENRTDIYNEIARVMASKLKENNQKGILTSFIVTFLKEHKNSSVTLSENVLRNYVF
ncbi:hypothetical protein ES708_27416 [subsurface metagenome]